MALQLQRAGVAKIHPLEGGFDAWRKLELPVEPVAIHEPAQASSV